MGFGPSDEVRTTAARPNRRLDLPVRPSQTGLPAARALDTKNITGIVLFMAANSLLAGAVQMLCVIAWRGDEGANAEVLAKSLNTNPVVVRRILKALEGQ